MEGNRIRIGLDWSWYEAGDFLIEPEDLDFGVWQLWQGKEHIHTGTLQECKRKAEQLTTPPLERRK